MRHALWAFLLFWSSGALRFDDKVYNKIEQDYQNGTRKSANEDFLNNLISEGFAVSNIKPGVLHVAHPVLYFVFRIC